MSTWVTSPTVTITSETPWRSPTFATIVVVPGPAAATSPSGETFATFGFVEVQTTGEVTMPPLEFFRVVVSDIVVPTGPTRWAVTGAISIVLMSRTSTGICIDSFSKLAVTIDFPSASDSGLPEPSTLTPPALEAHNAMGTPSTGWPFLSTARPVRRVIRPRPNILTGRGETSIEAGLREHDAASPATSKTPRVRRITFSTSRLGFRDRIAGLRRIAAVPGPIAPMFCPSTGGSAGPAGPRGQGGGQGHRGAARG